MQNLCRYAIYLDLHYLSRSQMVKWDIHNCFYIVNLFYSFWIFRTETNIKNWIESTLTDIFFEKCGTNTYFIYFIILGLSSTPNFQLFILFILLLLRFMNVLVDMNSEERKAFLQFTTGCSSLPPGGLANLHPRLVYSRVLLPSTWRTGKSSS